MTEEHKSVQLEFERGKRQVRTIGAVAIVLLGIGTVFYHIVEKLAWLDSVYFCVVTLATVGYGDIVPKTNPGKAFTIFYILAGVGIIATFANLFLKQTALRRDLRHHQANAKNTTLK